MHFTEPERQCKGLSSVDSDDHAVIGELDPGRKAGIVAVGDFVGQVGEYCPVRIDCSDSFQDRRNVEVVFMRGVAEGINDQDFNPCQQGER